MNCEQAGEIIEALLDREAMDELPEAVRQHLAVCAECARNREELCLVETALRAEAREEEIEWPSRMRSRVLAALRQEEQRGKTGARVHSRLRRLALLAAAATLLIGIGLWHLTMAGKSVMNVTPKTPPTETAPQPITLSSLEFLDQARFDPSFVLQKPKQDLKDFTDSILTVVNDQ